LKHGLFHVGLLLCSAQNSGQSFFAVFFLDLIKLGTELNYFLEFFGQKWLNQGVLLLRVGIRILMMG
jgi:uncharacterized membrane protein (DUF441 family)